MKFKPSADLWIVGILFVFTFVLAYISSLQQPVCIDSNATPSVWEVTSWPMKVVVFQLLLGFVLYAFSQSRRFAAPIEYVEDAPRAQTEYVASMADLVRRAGNRTLILDTLSRQFKSELTMKLGLQPSSTDHEILRALRVQHPDLEPKVRDVFQRELDLMNQSQINDLLRWAREIAQVRKNWRRAT